MYQEPVALFSVQYTSRLTESARYFLLFYAWKCLLILHEKETIQTQMSDPRVNMWQLALRKAFKN